tara:strand:- start:1314 stop:1445 length:132 start_codon:yes stop_codon:yes gene_type:complete
MIKKIVFLVLLCCVVISCGKKGDPEYKDSKKEEVIPAITINKA